MTLQDKILRERSKAYTIHLVSEIGHDHDKIDELWNLVKTGEPPVPRRAAWVLDYCARENRDWVEANVEELIAQLPRPGHNALQRTIAKILSGIDIPEELQGELFGLCLDWMMKPAVQVAVKVHCMSIAYNIAGGIPELEEELSLVIQDQMEYNSAGFAARGKQILKKMGFH